VLFSRAQRVTEEGVMRLLLLVVGVALATRASAQPLIFNGGSLLTSPEVVVVLWGADAGTVLSPETRTFYEVMPTLGHFGWLNEYDTATQHLGVPSFLGYFEIHPATTRPKLTATDIARELASQIRVGGLPSVGGNAYYAVYPPDGVAIDDGEGDQLCHKASAAAYHGDLRAGGMPGAFGIFGSCGRGPKTAFHELIEAMTDPLVNGWTTADGDEIADLCEVFQTSLVVADGGVLAIQELWSNQTNSCRASDEEFRIFLSPFEVTASTELHFSISAEGPGISPDQVSWNLPDLPPDAGYQIASSPDGGSPGTLTLHLEPPYPSFVAIEASAGPLTATAVVTVVDEPAPITPRPYVTPTTAAGCLVSGDGPIPSAFWLPLLLVFRVVRDRRSSRRNLD
jgi:hypothetical protein